MFEDKLYIWGHTESSEVMFTQTWTFRYRVAGKSGARGMLFVFGFVVNKFYHCLQVIACDLTIYSKIGLLIFKFLVHCILELIKDASWRFLVYVVRMWYLYPH